MNLKKKITIRHVAGKTMTSIETENTSNKIPRQYRYQ
jgi:PBP1b-binding outer membrane lipoprotein LpoB